MRGTNRPRISTDRAAAFLRRAPLPLSMLGRHGFYGYVAWLGAWLTYFTLIGSTVYIFQVLLAPWLGEISSSRAAITTTFTIFMATLGLMTPLSGWVIQRFSARTAILLGGSIGVAGLVLTALFAGNTLTLYLLFGFVTGLGVAIGGFLPPQVVINNWFIRRRGVMMGIGLTGGGLGGFVSLPAMQLLMDTTGSWRTALLVWAALLAFGVVVSVLLIRDRPSDKGQYPDGLTQEDYKEFLQEGNSEAREERANQSRVWRSPWDFTLAEAMHTPAFWLLVFGMFFIFFPAQFLNSQQVVYMTGDLNIDPVRAASIAGLVTGVSIVGRVGIGVLGDLLDTSLLYVFAAVVLIVGVVLIWRAPLAPGVMLALYPVIYGLGYGAIIILQPLIMANYFGVRHYPMILGVMVPLLDLVGAAVAPLGGYIYDTHGSYDLMFILTIAVAITGALLFVFARPPRRAPESGRQGI